jgi:hypothetical protein
MDFAACSERVQLLTKNYCNTDLLSREEWTLGPRSVNNYYRTRLHNASGCNTLPCPSQDAQVRHSRCMPPHFPVLTTAPRHAVHELCLAESSSSAAALCLWWSWELEVHSCFLKM